MFMSQKVRLPSIWATQAKPLNEFIELFTYSKPSIAGDELNEIKFMSL